MSSQARQFVCLQKPFLSPDSFELVFYNSGIELELVHSVHLFQVSKDHSRVSPVFGSSPKLKRKQVSQRLSKFELFGCLYKLLRVRDTDKLN